MRAHHLERNSAHAHLRAWGCAAVAIALAAATSGCAHDPAPEVRTTGAPVHVAPRPAPATQALPVAPTTAIGHDPGVAPLENDVTPGTPLGSPTSPGGQYGNGTAGASSETHKGTWRGSERNPDPKSQRPDPIP